MSYSYIQLRKLNKKIGLRIVDDRTIKDGKAVLSGGRQRLASRVQLVAVVPNADLELDGLTWLLKHARTVKHCAQRVLSPPLVFLHKIKGTRWTLK